ncbi:MAG TPA: F0F1 ATP synthase subunit alpha [Candidatus Babeliales bacterium]|nr:F0F1 ATP synthase subunit alpha [Candidatus Babeliales bacterium]
MEIKSSDLISLFEKALNNIDQAQLEEIGVVIQVGDSMCKVHGLRNAVLGELVTFEGGNRGIIFNLDEDYVSIFLFDAAIAVDELEVVKRTGSVFKIPVGDNLLGRVIDAVGKPIDGLGAINVEQTRSIEAEAPGIIERSPINESLETGIMSIDALIPVGKGQRELIIGNRNTGKTAVVLDTIVHQKDKNVLCVYVSIGQRQANLARFIKTLEEHGALEYTVVVSADSSDTVLRQYVAPYVGCSIAEYFRDQGRDVLIVYDDLSNHAIAYREMSLLLRRSPGREAYPGDVFYLHSRLLERAGKLAKGGSITAFPVVQIQSDDITAYIPTNLISITDGQIFLDTHLFNQGVRPAVNVELSVSRVGGAAQTKAIKKMTRALRLELAQYHELLDFAQFGTELDPVAQKRLNRGALAVELLKQPQFAGYSFVDQSLMLFLLKENFLDALPIRDVQTYAQQFVSYVKSIYQETYETIFTTQDVSEQTQNKLIEIAREFTKIFVPKA